MHLAPSTAPPSRYSARVEFQPPKRACVNRTDCGRETHFETFSIPSTLILDARVVGIIFFKYNNPMDRHWFRFTDITPEALKAELAAGKGDGEILAWVQE